MSLQEEVTTENDISEVPAVSSNNNSTIYDRKRQSKAIRVLTVLAYILSVSLAAIFLSIYYIFVWDGHPTLAAKNLPQPHTSLEDMQKPSQQTSSDLAAVKNATESFHKLYTKRNVFENPDSRSTTKRSAALRQHSNASAIVDNDLPSSTWTTTNIGLDVPDDVQVGLSELTTESEDTTLFSTASTEENSTWLPELNDYNSEFSEFNKRSIFMKKLFGRQNMIPQ